MTSANRRPRDRAGAPDGAPDGAGDRPGDGSAGGPAPEARAGAPAGGRGAIGALNAILDELEAHARALREPPRLLAEEPASARGGGARADEDAAPTARLGDLFERLDERAFGLVLLFLALPCCLPFVYLLPQIVSLPMMALAGQLAAGRRTPWLPTGLRDRRFDIAEFRKVLNRSASYVGWIERLARPRLAFVTGPVGARVVGALLIAPTASILTPLPSTNTVPGIGVALTSLGLIERDGLLVLAGLALGFLWIGLLLFLGVEAASLIKDFLAARL